MNTFCRVQVEVGDSVSCGEAVEEVFSELRRLENTFSRYLSESQVSRVNSDAENSPVAVNEEVFQLVARALEISCLTEGAFDISIGADVDFWRQCERDNCLPTSEQIKALKDRIGYKYIALDYQSRAVSFTRPGIKIDLGALAKGYVLDKAVTILKQMGISKACLNLGGNIYILDSQPQDILLRNPLSDESFAARLSLMNASISTSANDERYFLIQNKRFGHLLNPLTGLPAETDILSVSIISEDATFADALSTAIFVLGLKKGRELIGRVKDIQAVIISKDTKVYPVTPGLRSGCNGVYKMEGGKG